MSRFLNIKSIIVVVVVLLLAGAGTWCALNWATLGPQLGLTDTGTESVAEPSAESAAETSPDTVSPEPVLEGELESEPELEFEPAVNVASGPESGPVSAAYVPEEDFDVLGVAVPSADPAADPAADGSAEGLGAYTPVTRSEAAHMVDTAGGRAVPGPVSTDGRNAVGYITLIDEVEVPAEETGVLKTLDVSEGDEVEMGAVLGQIDDEQVRMAVDVATAKLEAAKQQANNDVNVRYAEAARNVAAAEIQQAWEANAKTPNTVTNAEVNRLKLAHIQATLQIEQATHELTVAKYNMRVQEAELAAANLNVKKKQILAPISGIVIERFRHAGEWVKPGDPVVKMIRLDKVRVKFLVSSHIPQENLLGHAVSVTLPGSRLNVTFSGKITFIEQSVDQGNQYQVWAEIDNQKSGPSWILMPGMPANVEIRQGR